MTSSKIFFSVTGSLKASRRRPVSVDTDYKVAATTTTTTTTTRGGGAVGGVVSGRGTAATAPGRGDEGAQYQQQQQQLQDVLRYSEGEQRSRHSNRNSHPFTEREIEQGQHHMEPTNGE